MTLEVLLKGCRFGAVAKCDGGLNPPRSMICSWLHMSLVMLFQSEVEISREPGVMAFRGIDTDELINVVEHVDGLPGRSF